MYRRFFGQITLSTIGFLQSRKMYEFPEHQITLEYFYFDKNAFL
jgi:hypothetical protein